MVTPAEVDVGSKLVDLADTTENRIVKITKMHRGHNTFSVKNLYTGRVTQHHFQEFEGFDKVPTQPVFNSDADQLVGEFLRLELVDGGQLSGECTAVRYRTTEINGKPMVHVYAVEIDKSAMTTYLMAEIAEIHVKGLRVS